MNLQGEPTVVVDIINNLRTITVPDHLIDELIGKIENYRNKTTPLEEDQIESVRVLNETARQFRNILFNPVSEAYNAYKTSHDTLYSLVDELNRVVDVNRRSEYEMAGGKKTRKRRRRLNRRHSRKH